MIPINQSLMKIFSLVLKERAKTQTEFRSISPAMVKFFSRKELIEIITQKFQGQVPKEYNLLEMENQELLAIIGDDFYIISFVCGKWSLFMDTLPVAEIAPLIPESVARASAKAHANKNKNKEESTP